MPFRKGTRRLVSWRADRAYGRIRHAGTTAIAFRCRTHSGDPLMTVPRAQRRLAAILAADLAGYSRMMGEDEAGSISALREVWATLFNPTVAEHGGRIVKLMGDGALVEFASAVDAVACAIEIQTTASGARCRWLRGQSDPIPDRHQCRRHHHRRRGHPWRRRQHRGADRGHSPNLAASRFLEDAWRQVQGKVAANFVDAGEQSLKNIATPVRCLGYRLAQAPKAATAPKRRGRRPRSPTSLPSPSWRSTT